ncbi:hypothetical protein BDW74DRAFT_167359 [Aspergillus multicolor]|uniref:uncharacterized protein n=1 Tax=Aspergillus multicolor TaxID=41759 RepID=UPI003CCDD8CE
MLEITKLTQKPPSQPEPIEGRKLILACSMEDYTDLELHRIFERQLRKRKLQVEGGLDNDPLLTLSHKIGLRRAESNFGNAHAVRNELEHVLRRQSKRLRGAIMLNQDEPSSYNILTHEDILGPSPKNLLDRSTAWKELRDMVGLHNLKASVQTLLGALTLNYHRQLCGKPPSVVPLEKVIIGPPGTGKFTAARLYGQIIVDLGLVPESEVVVKNPSDLLHDHVGGPEKKARDALEASEGKVLILNDFHMLYQKDTWRSNTVCSFRRGVVDTLVANISSSDARCIILDLLATDEARRVACEILTRARGRPNFGNGGDVGTLPTHAKYSYLARVQHLVNPATICLLPQDLDTDYSQKLEGPLHSYKQIATGMRLANLDYKPHIPFAFIFKGPPGTGKTSTARIFGELFYDLGFLSTTNVIECSVSDLISEYVGQTGPKVVALLERALGTVLFVDEAYRLAEELLSSDQTSLGREAVGELVDAMIKPQFARKLVIILAGYTAEMDNLMQSNPGLRSRFPTVVEFPAMTPEHSLEYLARKLGEVRILMPPPAEEGQGGWEATVVRLFKQLGQTPSWANARDVNELASVLTGQVYWKYRTSGEVPALSADDLIVTMNEMLLLRDTDYKRPVKADQA